MLNLVADNQTAAAPDTDFEFLADSESTPDGELRTGMTQRAAEIPS